MSRLLRHLALLCAFVLTLLVAASASAGEEGKNAFLEYKCNKCHAVESLGIEVLAADEDEEEEDVFGEEEEEVDPPDLSKGSPHLKTADEISEWVQKKLEIEGRKHQSKFRGPKKDLQLISEWIVSLKSE